MDRHLLPDEIDQLLDGESGFGTAPLKAHVRRCEECRVELDAARALVRALEHLPHLSPSAAFSDRVMQQVQIFVPWHVALLDSVRGWLPRSRTARMAAGGALATAAVIFWGVALWAYTRIDTIAFAVNLAADRAGSAVVNAVSEGLVALVGATNASAIRGAGVVGAMGTILALMLLAALSARGLYALASSARRRQ